ncbi:lytic protein Rz1 [Gallibacterium genomosp. 1]|nr:lytic protein Rz1 [Gallibacterium genomosp. 1]
MPAVLISYLDRTEFNGRTYGDVAQYAVILKRERDICLNRIDRIREWQVEKMQK